MSRVGDLSLDLVVAGATQDQVQRWQRALETDWLQRVLDTMEAAVHDRLGPEVIVAVQSLESTWELSEEDLHDPDAVRRVGTELADAILPSDPRPLPRPDPRSGVAIFSDETHRRAVLAVEAATDGPGWYHAVPAPANPATAWIAARPEHAEALISHLERLGGSEAVLRAEGSAFAAVLQSVLPTARWPVSLLRAASRTGAVPFASAGAAPPGPPESSALLAAPNAEPEGAEVSSPHSFPAAALTSQDRQILAVAEALPTDTLHVAELAPLRSPSEAPPPIESSTAGGTTSPAQSSSMHMSRSGQGAEQASSEHTPVTSGIREAMTEHAGLFYLVARVLELDLGEHLWSVGLREGQVLALATAALIDVEHDPAPALFGGMWPEQAVWPKAQAWAVEEVKAKALVSLTEMLRRRTGSAERVQEQVERVGRSLVLPAQASAEDRELVSFVAGVLAYGFMACTGRDSPLTHFTRRSGRVLLAEEELIVSMALDDIDLDLRMAGLDQDPGYAPWLERTVRIVFEEG